MFELPDPIPFYKLVWEIVRQIPAGTAATYGQVASMIPAPEGVEQSDYNKLGPRWVGDAMNAVSTVDEKSVPWHRVINAKGGISLPDTSKSAALQRARLRDEHVLLENDERVNLDEFAWEGPDEQWLDDHGLKAPKSLKKAKPFKQVNVEAPKPQNETSKPKPENEEPPTQMSLF